MSRFEKDIKDDEIRVLGTTSRTEPKPKRAWWPAALVAVVVVVAIDILLIFIPTDKDKSTSSDNEPALFEQVPVQEAEPLPTINKIGKEVDSTERPHTEILDTTINDIPLRIYIPHNARMTLHLGRIDKTDSTIVFAAQAADVRADNGGIVGAFVLKGEPKSWGLSKKGFVASIDGKITIGVAENSPLFEEATEKGGYFFRQYPLVDNGRLVENEPKGKAVRRAICNRAGEIFMVESITIESFHDFSQALVDLGVDQAVYLVGSVAYGWAVDEAGERHEFGNENIYKSRYRRMPKNTSYIVWR